jgi:hypothetical protein
MSKQCKRKLRARDPSPGGLRPYSKRKASMGSSLAAR